MVLKIPKERQMNMEDIPALGDRTRSQNLRANFLEKHGEGRLWAQLIRVFSFELLVQWILTLVIACLALFPQVVLYNFLVKIESREDYSTTDPVLFAWVIGLLLSQLF